MPPVAWTIKFAEPARLIEVAASALNIDAADFAADLDQMVAPLEPLGPPLGLPLGTHEDLRAERSESTAKWSQPIPRLVGAVSRGRLSCASAPLGCLAR